jgi:hypothetical protein
LMCVSARASRAAPEVRALIALESNETAPDRQTHSWRGR